MITLNYRDSRPIYEQIQEGLKRLIVTGAIAAEERLPSVRTLATQLSINPNTIQRAYTELEREGYCYSVPGKGSFVSGSVDMGEKRRKELKDRLCALAAELKFLGVTEEELIELVQRVPEREETVSAVPPPDAARVSYRTGGVLRNDGGENKRTDNAPRDGENKRTGGEDTRTDGADREDAGTKEKEGDK